MNPNVEVELIKERYERRKMNSTPVSDKSFMASLYGIKERELEYGRIVRKHFGQNLSDKKVIEIGAGSGSNLLWFQYLGFKWENIYANELLEDRYQTLCERLPNSTCIQGDALELKYENYFDVVFQSTVFTSILDEEFRRQLAQKMWDICKPGGIILSYDFTYNNPNNPDVLKLTKKDIKKLFPQSQNIQFKKVTLAPPISKKIGRLYDIVNTLCPFLRTHLITVIKK